jgi:probable rRNA maturation factor
MIEVELTLQVQLRSDPTDIMNFEVLDHQTGPADISMQQWQQWFEQWLCCLDPKLSALNAYEVSLLLTTDTEIERFNAAYRGQNIATDVLAFAALEWEGPVSARQRSLPVNLGDIIVSVETAARQAADQNHSLAVELAWLACHGLLHLLGWDHPDAAQLNEMLTEQSVLMGTIGLVAPVWTPGKLGYID